MTETQRDAAAKKALGKAMNGPVAAADPVSNKRRTTKRTVAVATVDGQRFLMFRDVAAITSYHVATIYRKLNDPDDDFPRPVRLSANRVAFREADIAKWMADRAERLPAKPPVKPRLRSSSLRQLATGKAAR